MNSLNLPISKKNLFLIFIIPLAFTLILVGRAKIGGDEEAIFSFVLDLKNHHFNYISFFKSNYGNRYLSLHLFDFFILSFTTLIWHSIGWLIPFLQNTFILGTLVSYTTVMANFFSMILMMKIVFMHCKNFYLSFLICVGFWFGGYSIAFLTGGHIESYMILMILLRVYVQSCENEKKRLAAFIIIDTALGMIKAYSLLFCFLSLPYFFKFNKKDLIRFSIYSFFVLGINFIWMKAKNGLYNQGDYFSTFIVPFEIMTKTWYIPKNIFEQFFGFTYGLVWGLPLYFIFIPFCYSKKVLLNRFFPVFSIMLFLSTISFWSGHSGIPGSRYIFPFLIWLIPQFTEGVENVLQRFKTTSLLIPLCIIFFLPVINFRNNLIVDIRSPNLISQISDAFLPEKKEVHRPQFKLWNENTVHNWDPIIGLEWEINMHPAIFAWNIFFQTTFSDIVKLNLKNESPSAASNEINHMTLISRVKMLRSPPASLEKRYPDIVQKIKSLPIFLFTIIQILPYLLILYWLIIILFFLNKKL